MKILIVDDSRAMRMMVRRALRQAGFSSLEFDDAENGKKGLEKYESFSPDLVLSDWNMPEVDGLEFLVRLKNVHPDAKFGFVTSQATAIMKKQAKDAGALFLISKPFSPENFRDTLAPYIR